MNQCKVTKVLLMIMATQMTKKKVQHSGAFLQKKKGVRFSESAPLGCWRKEEGGLCEIEVYIQRRRDIMFNFVKNREIYQESLELETDVENSNQ